MRQSCWDPTEVPLVRSHVREEGSLQLWDLQHLCAAGGLASTVLVVSGFEDAFFSFMGCRLGGCWHVLHITPINACHIY